MTGQEMRIAVAESVEWTPFSDHKNPDFWFAPGEREKALYRTHKLPDYPRDLNAIMPLMPVGTIIRIWSVNGQANYNFSDGRFYVEGTSIALTACEFYLRKKGLWKE